MNEAYRDALLNVDSYGAIFMYATHKDLTTAPRHIIRMTEPVDPRVLLAAVRTALEPLPAVCARTGARRKAVQLPFSDQAARCPQDGRYFALLYWFGRYQRLSVPVRLQGQNYLSGIPTLHVGRTRFDEFIRTILYYYLRDMGHDVQPGRIRTNETQFTPQDCEDGYLRLRGMPQSDADHHPDVPSFHMPEYDSRNDDNELTTELTISLPQLLHYTKSNGVTPMTFLMTAISMGMYRTYYVGTDRTEPIIAEVPMDLRAYVKTTTTRFFVSLLDLRFSMTTSPCPSLTPVRRARRILTRRKTCRTRSSGHSKMPIASPSPISWTCRSTKKSR